MRITARTVPAGDTFMTRFPNFDRKIEDLSTDGRFDEAKARADLAGWQDAGYLLWGDDDRAALAFTVEFLSHMAAVTRHVESDASTDAHLAAASAADRRLERRMDSGRYAFTRFDITSRSDGILVRVSCANPFDIPGSAIASARRFGVYACRVLNYLKREIERGNKLARVNLVGVGEMDDIFDEAEWTERRMDERDAVEAANRKRTTCERRTGDFCSPVEPSCRCHKCGRCAEATLPDEFREYKRKEKA